jgi:hypothetical protein
MRIRERANKICAPRHDLTEFSLASKVRPLPVSSKGYAAPVTRSSQKASRQAENAAKKSHLKGILLIY